MKIWIDITNSPHVSFFKPFIRKWESLGHTVSITTRYYSNTIQLLDADKFSYSIIGRHAGRGTIHKLLNFPLRIFSLVRWLKRTKPTIGISQSSFYSPLAGWLCGVHTIYTNDNEHAKGNLLSFIFASQVLLPEPLRQIKKGSFLYFTGKIQYYSGIKEGLYLKGYKVRELPKETNKNLTVYFRPDPWEAEYYTTDIHFINNAIRSLSKVGNLVVLPRNVQQYEYFNSNFSEEVDVVKGVLSLDEILRNADLFVGAGGSMSRELAVLGVPTISIYRGELLTVDRFLLELGVLHHMRSINSEEIISILRSKPSNQVCKELLRKGEIAFEEFNKTLLLNNKK